MASQTITSDMSLEVVFEYTGKLLTRKVLNYME